MERDREMGAGGAVIDGKTRIFLYNDGFFTTFFLYFSSLFNTALSAAPQVTLCRRMLESNPGQLRLRHCPETLTKTRLDLIHELFYKCIMMYVRLCIVK